MASKFDLFIANLLQSKRFDDIFGESPSVICKMVSHGIPLLLYALDFIRNDVGVFAWEVH